jgi:hypothetical protein
MPLTEMNTRELRNELARLSATMSRAMLVAILTLLEAQGGEAARELPDEETG